MTHTPRALLTAALIALTCASAPFAAAAGNPEVTVEKSFGSGGFNWQKYGSMQYRYAVVDIDGMAAVCGAYATVGGHIAHKFNKAALKEMKLVLDGKTLRKSMLFFKSLPSDYLASNLEGTTANCRVTKTPYSSALKAAKLVARSGSYKISK